MNDQLPMWPPRRSLLITAGVVVALGLLAGLAYWTFGYVIRHSIGG